MWLGIAAREEFVAGDAVVVGLGRKERRPIVAAGGCRWRLGG